MLLQIGPLFTWVHNVITDGTSITLGSKCYYRWDLYYTWVQLLPLCLQQPFMGWLGNEGVDNNWDETPVSSPVTVLSHLGEFNKE